MFTSSLKSSQQNEHNTFAFILQDATVFTPILGQSTIGSGVFLEQPESVKDCPKSTAQRSRASDRPSSLHSIMSPSFHEEREPVSSVVPCEEELRRWLHGPL